MDTNDGLVKVNFLLAEDAMLESEGLWALPEVDGTYILDNAPMYFTGVAVGDRVTVEIIDGSLWANAVVGTGGHANIWVQSLEVGDDSAYAHLQRIAKKLESLNVFSELEDEIPRLVVDVEDSNDGRAALAELVQLELAKEIECVITNEVDWL